MNEFYAAREDVSGEVFYRRMWLLIRENRRAWQSTGAAFGLAGSMLSILLGALLWVTVHFLAPGSFGSFLNVVEIAFFAATLPLLALGAYCLDLLEGKPPAFSLRVKSRPDGFERRRRL